MLPLPVAELRRVIDLDAGWSYARVPAPPSVWTGPDAVPTAAWRVRKLSSEETAGEDARAVKAFDRREDTFWHTEWSRRKAPYPHSLSIDLGGPTAAVGLRLLPRQTGPQNGRPRRFRLFLDDRLVKEGVVPDSAARYETRFPASRGRALRLEFLDGYRPEPFLALAEIGLIREVDPKVRREGKTGHDVVGLRKGEELFDPSPALLERLKASELRAIRAWSPATLPHAAWIRPLGSAEVWQGVAYYRRRLPAPPPGTRAVLELQGMQRVDAWLDGKPLASRRGGYLPLRAELDRGGELLVRVDNGDDPLVPPGKPQSALDFVYGAGLIGHATLTLTDPLHITDPLEENVSDGGLFVDPPSFARGVALTWTHSRIRNSGDELRRFVVRHTILDAAGATVVRRERTTELPPNGSLAYGFSMAVPTPKLWSPASPTLYRLRAQILVAGRIVDSVERPFGLRTIAVSKAKGLLVNGRPVRLVGTNRHQDYPWVGPALSDAAQRRDALLIKRAGHNVVRLSHYNQSPAFLDACDELGILTIPCIPGWQFVNDDPRFKARVLRDIRETIRRDRGHPSVLFWEASLNETYPAAPLAKSWYDAAHAEGAAIVAGDRSPGAPWDVVYNDWRPDLTRPNLTPRPGYIREYGDYEFGGANSTSRARIGAGIDRLLDEAWNHVWSYNRFRPGYPSTMGAGTWEMFDHDVPWPFAVSASGLADLMRREKPSFWFYASQAETRPYLKIAATWAPGAARRTIVVFTDAPVASLFIDGRLVDQATAIRGFSTGYSLKNAFDGTNTGNLLHPPLVFRDVPFVPGELKVVGSNGATDVVRTAGPPVALKLWTDDLGVPPTGNDLVFFRAAVVDAQGVVCPAERRRVTFAGATFAGERTVPCEMGVASALVRTPPKGGTIVVRAAAFGLKAARVTLRVGSRDGVNSRRSSGKMVDETASRRRKGKPLTIPLARRWRDAAARP